MGIIKASTGEELTSGITDKVWSDYEGNVMLAPINNIIPDPEFEKFEALDDGLRYWNLLASPAITHWIPFVRDETIQKRFSKQVAGYIPLSTDVFDIRDELVPGASPLDESETIAIAPPAAPIVTPIQVSTTIGLPAGWYTLTYGFILDEDWQNGKRLTGQGRPSQPFQIAQGQGLQFEPPTEIPANVFGIIFYLTEPQATSDAARDASTFYEQIRYGVRDLPRPCKILGPYEARHLAAGNTTFIGAKASMSTLEAARRGSDVGYVAETTTDTNGNTVNAPITTGQVQLSYRVETIQGTSFSKDPSGFINVQNNGTQMLSFRPRSLPPNARGWIPEFVVNGVWYQIMKNDGGFFAPGEFANIYTSEPSNWPGSAFTNTSESGGPSREDTTGMKPPDDPMEVPIILDLTTSGLTPGRHYVKTALLAGEEEGPVSPITAVDVPPGYGLRIRRPLIVNKLENSDVGERKITSYSQPRAWDISPGALIVRNSISESDASGGTTSDPIATTPGIPVNDVPSGSNTLGSPSKTVSLDISVTNFVSGSLNVVSQVYNSSGTLVSSKIVQRITQSQTVSQSSSATPEGAQSAVVNSSSVRQTVTLALTSGSVNRAWEVDTTGGSVVKVQVQKAGSVRTGGKNLEVSIGYPGVFDGGAVPSPMTLPTEGAGFDAGFPFYGTFPWPGFPFTEEPAGAKAYRNLRRAARRARRAEKRAGRGTNPPTPPDQPPTAPRPPQPPAQLPPPPPKPPTASKPELVEQLAYEFPSGGYCHVVQNPIDGPRKENYTTIDYSDFGTGSYGGWVPTNTGLGTIQQYLSANQNSFETNVTDGISGNASRWRDNTVARVGLHSMGVKAEPANEATDQYTHIGPIHLPDGGNYAWSIQVYCPTPTRLNLKDIGIMEGVSPWRRMAVAGDGYVTLPTGWSTLSGAGAIPNDWHNNVYLRLLPASKDTVNEFDSNKIVYYDDAYLGLVYSSTINEISTFSGMLSSHGLRFQKYADGTPVNYVTKTITPRSTVSVSVDLYTENYSGLSLEPIELLDTDGVSVAAAQVLDAGNLRIYYKDATGAQAFTDYATGIDNNQFISIELYYNTSTKVIQAYIGKNEYAKALVVDTIASYTGTAPINTVRLGGNMGAAPNTSRYTTHIGQVKITDLPTMPNSEPAPGNYIEYFSPDNTPLDAHYGPTNLRVPVKPNQTYTIGINTWYQDMMEGSELFKTRARAKNGEVLQVYDSVVTGMTGDRERWERYFKTITTPPGTAFLEFFANNLGGGKLRIHGLQMEEGSVGTAFNSTRARTGSFSVYLNNRQPGMKGMFIDPLFEISRVKRLRRIFVDGHDTNTTSYSVRYRTGNTLAEIAGKAYTNDFTALSRDDDITEVNITMSSSVDGDTPEIRSIFLDVERPYAQLLRANGTEYNGGVLVNNITTPSAPPNIELINVATGGIRPTTWGSDRVKRISFTMESFRRSTAEEIMYYSTHTLETDDKRYLVIFESPPDFKPSGKRVLFTDGSEYFLRETADVTAIVLRTEDLF